jgi:hypothetical protein
MRTNNKRFGPKLCGRRYPWEVWFSQKQFIISKGNDYWCKTYSMAQIVRNAAHRYKLGIQIETSEDDMQLRVTVSRPLKDARLPVKKAKPRRLSEGK